MNPVPQLRELFTIVHRNTTHPVIPLDCNPESDDEGMIVFLSRDAAEKAAEHQADLYSLDCEARSLERVLREM